MNITKKGKSLKAESSSSGKVAVMGITVSKRKRVEKASRLATVREGMFLQRTLHSPIDSWSFHLESRWNFFGREPSQIVVYFHPDS